MNIKEIIKHFKTQAQSRFNPSPDGSREAYYNGRKDAYNDCADILERYAVKYPNGWHPASELPPLDEDGNSAELIAITCDNNLMKVYFHYESEEYNFWVESDDWNKQVKYGVNVKWWCYQPNDE